MDPQMHAPGSNSAHCLPVAGLRPPANNDVYRYNRVVPLYTQDPCIPPNAGQMMCPPDCGFEKRNDLMEPAGMKTPIETQFQFYEPRPSNPETKRVCGCPAFSGKPPCASGGPITDRLECPCINRCKPLINPRPWKKQDLYPSCLNPALHRTQPCPKCRKACRKWDVIWDCPGNDPDIGPNMAMFLTCNDAEALSVVPHCP